MADKILSFRVDVQGVSKEAQELAKLDTALSKLNEERRESQQLLKKGNITRKQHEATLARLKSKTTDLKVERSRLTTIERQASKQYQSSTGSINQLRIRMTRLREEMRSLNLSTTKGRTKFKQLNNELQRGTTKLRGFDRQMSGSKTLVGEYGRGITSAFKGLAASFIGITALFRVLRDLVKVTGDFDSATAKLASITGKTRDEIADLTEDAKKLGSVSQFTASQVTDLQVSLAKLGFTVEDIRDATPAVIDFATATGAELGNAAKVAGVAVRAFGLDVLETGDAVAALAVGTTKSALAFEDYETILSTLGPVAKAYGFTLEDTIALTGTLRDAGFDASKAATATRNILLKLADANGELAIKLGGAATTLPELVQQLASLDEKGISLAETLEVTDLRSVAAFSQLLRGADSVGKLREEVTDVNEKLREMVEVRLDSYAGDVKALSSAWEGLILSFKASGVIREVTQFLKDAILQLSNLSLAFTKFHKQTDEQLSRSFDLLNALSNKQGQQFKEVVEQLEGISVDELLADPERFAAQFAKIKNVNKKEGKALFEELIRRREAAAEREIEIETAKIERIAADEIALEKKREADKRKITTKADEKVAKERAKQQEELNKALERTAVLLANIKDVGKLENTIFDIVTGEFSIENIEEQIANLEFVFTDLDASIIESSDATTQALIDNANKRFDNEDARAEQTAALLKQIEQEKVNISIAGTNEIFNVGSSFLDRRLQKLEEASKKELSNENLTAEKRKQIEEDFAEEKAKLRRKQAAIDKVQALFNIALNTAIGASNAASKIITLPLVPFIIGLGALQAAAVLAEPLPAFAFGGKVPSGFELSGSKRREDNTPVMLTPGEVVLNQQQQTALGGPGTFKRIGVPGFAAGGTVGVASPLPGTGIPDMNRIAALITNSLNAQRVILNVNELNAAEDDLAVINQTNEL